MRAWIVAAVGCLVVQAHAAGVSEATMKTVTQLRDQALKDESAYSLIEGLTTEIGPRIAGGPNDERARTWLVERLQSLGFDKIYQEPVSFPVWERGQESCEVSSPFPAQIRCAALGGSMGTGARPLQAEIIRFTDLKSLQDAPEGTAKGKIVFVDYSMSRARDGSGYGAASLIRVTGASIAASKGAAAFLLRSAGTDMSSRSPHTGVMRYAQMPTRIPAAALGNVDADLLASMLKRGAVRMKIQLGARTNKRQYLGANVIAEITGRERPEQIIVVGGHLDSWDLGTGALDDGAGIAITAAAAALIGKMPSAPRRTIRFIAWANEEQGIYGGKAYAEARRIDNTLARHTAASESDFGAGRVYKFDTRFNPESFALVDQIMQVLAPLGVARGNNEANGGPDVGPLRELGVPTFGLAQDGTHYFDYHHTENDTLDKIDPEALKQNVAAWSVVTYLLAEYEGSVSQPATAK